MKTNERLELIQQAAGPLPPFIDVLRMKIRAGEKTETRRVIYPQPDIYEDALGATHVSSELAGEVITEFNGSICKFIEKFPSPSDGPRMTTERKCNLGQAGEIRYLREPLIKWTDGMAHFYDDGALCLGGDGDPLPWRWQRSVLPQIFMPKMVARTFVRLDAIRGERLWAINSAGILAEGVKLPPTELFPLVNTESKLQQRFKWLWDSINAKRGYGWGGNWWVWVMMFDVIGDWHGK